MPLKVSSACRSCEHASAAARLARPGLFLDRGRLPALNWHPTWVSLVATCKIKRRIVGHPPPLMGPCGVLVCHRRVIRDATTSARLASPTVVPRQRRLARSINAVGEALCALVVLMRLGNEGSRHGHTKSQQLPIVNNNILAPCRFPRVDSC